MHNIGINTGISALLKVCSCDRLNTVQASLYEMKSHICCHAFWHCTSDIDTEHCGPGNAFQHWFESAAAGALGVSLAR